MRDGMSHVLKLGGRTVTRLKPAVFEVAAFIQVNLESEFFAFVKILTLLVRHFPYWKNSSQVIEDNLPCPVVIDLNVIFNLLT